MAFLRCKRDPCGVICLILTYFSVFYADYVVIQYVLLPAFTDSVWCTLHGTVFNLILLLLLACHSKAAVFSDPGIVPLPETAIDFSDLRSQSSRMNDRTSQSASLPRLPEVYTPHGPPLSLVRKRTHPSIFSGSHSLILLRHVEECGHVAIEEEVESVEEADFLNRLHFFLNFVSSIFVFCMASLYSMVLVVSAWVWRIRNERDGDAEKEGEEMPSKHLIVAHYIILLVESVLFGVFVMVIFYDQLVSIITDETPIEQMRNRLMMKDRGSSASSSSSSASSQPPHHPPHTRKPKLALLREVFGRGSVFCWLLPLHSSPPSVGGIIYHALPDYDV
ncbi:hypothetical protein FQN60_006383 [Etheostoma spectabile]|uniref:Palmitoyltransferase n=1 Tax=Etheostoma spectabile TaxID=54343 RepID=A0A5J5CL97_9PERO|nr:hypothetical protein FQN60_006383 [Etheostoma spectabile]